MGTQQMLLIALVVIIVGISVAVGISMFNNQGYNSNREALTSEMVTYPPTVVRFWKTAKLLGGAGADQHFLTQAKVAAYLGFTGANYGFTSLNGEFRVTQITGLVVTIQAMGVEERGGKHPFVTTTVDVSTGAVNTAVTEAATW